MKYAFCKKCGSKLQKDDIIIVEDYHYKVGLISKSAMCPVCGNIMATKVYAQIDVSGSDDGKKA